MTVSSGSGSAVHAERGGKRRQLNIQPVLPADLNPDWKLISRTILPVVWQDEICPGAGSQSGIGDIVQSVLFSPKALTAGGWTCGGPHGWGFRSTVTLLLPR